MEKGMSTRKVTHRLGRIVLLIVLVFIFALETAWAASKAEILKPKAGLELTGNNA